MQAGEAVTERAPAVVGRVDQAALESFPQEAAHRPQVEPSERVPLRADPQHAARAGEDPSLAGVGIDDANEAASDALLDRARSTDAADRGAEGAAKEWGRGRVVHDGMLTR
jgi:hypothetical protein